MKILAYLSLFLISFTALAGISGEPVPTSPPPEPNSLALLGIGAVGIAISNIRKK